MPPTFTRPAPQGRSGFTDRSRPCSDLRLCSYDSRVSAYSPAFDATRRRRSACRLSHGWADLGYESADGKPEDQPTADLSGSQCSMARGMTSKHRTLVRFQIRTAWSSLVLANSSRPVTLSGHTQ